MFKSSKFIAVASLIVIGSGAAKAQTEINTSVLEARATKIGSIYYEIGDVFDLTNPEEDKRLYRLANRAHITTRRSTLENILLVEPNDQFESRLLEESARAIRAAGYISEASVTPVNYDELNNTVDVQVTTRDAWSLTPELKLSRNGGVNEYGFGVAEENLLGLGKSLTASYSSDVDRDETFFEYFDPNVRSTRTRLNVILADTSDGQRTQFNVGRPFYALDSRWAIESAFNSTDRIDPIYGLGEVIDEFNHEIRAFSLGGGWSKGLRELRALRWLVGINLEEDRFYPSAEFPNTVLLPEDRKLAFPWFGLQIAEDDFRKMTELNDIGRTEDVPLGLALTVKVGYSSDNFGSDRNAVILRSDFHKGWEPGGAGRLLLFDATAAARKEELRTRNVLITSSFRYFQRNLKDQLFSASISATVGNRIDAEDQILLGGATGLRGYPIRYQSGEGSAVLTLEQRFFTDWYPLRLLRVGYAVFFDIGRVWGTDARNTIRHGTLYDIGVGLRLSSPRSSTRSVVHIDLAFPVNGPGDVDSVQLSVEKRAAF